MCIELTKKECCTKFHVMKDAIETFEPACDKQEGAELTLKSGRVFKVEECVTKIHELLHAE